MRGYSACCPERQDGFSNRQVKWRRHLNVGGPGIQHLYRPAETFVQRGIVGDRPALGLGLGVAAAQLIHLEPLRRLSRPELGTVGGSED